MLASWVIGAVVSGIYMLFQSRGIYGGDSGDMVTAAVIHGIPHPPGYPLYTLLGWLVSHIPFGSYAFRVGVLSSVPHAVTVALLFAVTYRLTRRVFPSLFTSALAFGNYLFFLYAVTPEVFGLFDLFVASLLLTLVLWYQYKTPGYLILMSFLTGASLTHHHVIVFILPAFVWVIWKERSHIPHTVWFTISCVLVFLCGMLPYLYVPIAARTDPVINYDRAVTIDGFRRLVTRADYGTFASSASIGETIADRLLSVRAYGEFLLVDFTVIGLILGTAGFFWLRKKQKRIFWVFLLSLVSVGPVFFFYASFPLANGFMLATFERFLLPGYLILFVTAGIGAWRIREIAVRFLPARLTRIGMGIVLSALPVMIAGMTVWRFWGLSADRTADNLGRDLLMSAPRGAIILMAQDTSLFLSQYMRYAAGVRSDVTLLHASRMVLPEYLVGIRRNFPGVTVPTPTGGNFYAAFAAANFPRHRIFSNIALSVGSGWVWVPHGLLLEAVPTDAAPVASEMYRENVALWSEFSDPTHGILSRYRHLMLTDVLDVYANARIVLGETLMRASMWDEAQRELSEAIRLNGDVTRSLAFTQLGLVKLQKKDCTGALRAFTDARTHAYAPNPVIYLYESVTYRDCLHDPVRADELGAQYRQLKSHEDQPLNQL